MKISRIKKIRHDFHILKELHGNQISPEEAKGILSQQFEIPYKDVEFALNYDNIDVKEKPSQDFGIVIGRFQPFHFGHQHIINEIILDGRRPIVLLGDDNGRDSKRNPLSFSKRVTLIEQVFPNECDYYQIFDNPDWTKWFKSIMNVAPPEKCTLYYHNKPEDCYESFECFGKTYKDTFYTDIFKDNGYSLKEVEFVERNDIHVDADAKNIRENFEAFKHLMDGRNYWTLKSWGW